MSRGVDDGLSTETWMVTKRERRTPRPSYTREQNGRGHRSGPSFGLTAAETALIMEDPLARNCHRAEPFVFVEKFSELIRQGGTSRSVELPASLAHYPRRDEYWWRKHELNSVVGVKSITAVRCARTLRSVAAAVSFFYLNVTVMCKG